MKIIRVKQLAIPEIKTVKFEKFTDERGYFTEHFRKSDFEGYPELQFFKKFKFLQANESYSRKGTVRGLHLQWNPYMGKLIRTIEGHMVDMILDIRLNSPTFGKIILFDMPMDKRNTWGEWIWVPPGFAHGNFFLEDTLIEYLCTGEYNPKCEAGISPLSTDIDWSIADNKLKKDFEKARNSNLLISDKDKNGYSLDKWSKSRSAKNFLNSNLEINR